MKILLTKWWCVLLLLCTCDIVPTYAQASLGEVPGEIQIYSPQAWDFMKYGNSEMKLYTGTINLDIPVYTYQDYDFTLPLSLKYASNGFMPNKIAGCVGMGWFLNIGGVITRKVNGIADETSSVSYGDMENRLWYEHGYQKNPGIYDYNIPLVTNENFPFYSMAYHDNSDYFPRHCYESEPDVFRFNFMGFKGAFQFTSSPGDLVVYNTNCAQGEIKVEKIKLDTAAPVIILKTGDGYSYQFGGCEAALEYTYEDNSTLVPKYPNAWYLTEIKAPNGRKMRFHYEEGIKPVNLYTPLQEILYNDASHFCSEGDVYANEIPLKRVFIKPVRLLSVDVNSEYWEPVKIFSFVYDDKSPEIVSGNRQIEGKMLTEIGLEVYKNQKVAFTYQYPDSGNPKLLLQSVDIPGKGKYQMEYYNGDCPAVGCYAIDYWGYFNDRATPANFIPARVKTSTLEETIISDSREPVPAKSLLGMLKKLVYPTKGFSEFEYESHDYSLAVKKMPGNDYIPALYPADNVLAGGLRIKKITDFDGINRTQREFLYRKSLNSSQSSGILLHYPRYGVYANYKFGNELHVKYKISSDSKYYSLDPYHIEYSTVIERLNDNSLIEYEFSNYQTIPDVITSEGEQPAVAGMEFLNNEMHLKNLIRETNSRHPERGKLIRRVLKDSHQQPQSQEEYIYDTDRSDYLKVLKVAANTCYYQRIYHKNSLLSKIVRSYFAGEAKWITEKSFEYNSYGQLAKSVEGDGLNAFRASKYTYLPDIAQSNRTEAQNELFARHIINTPLEKEEVIYSSGGPEKVLRREKWIFEMIDSVPLLRKWTQTTGNITKEVTYNKYNRYGKPAEITGVNGKITSYIWGCFGLMPVAKVENASLDYILTLKGFEDYGRWMFQPHLYENAEKSLRKIPHAYVTTYSYNGFGLELISEIRPDSRGRKYRYDETGRLIMIGDQDDYLIEKYEYHFQK